MALSFDYLCDKCGEIKSNQELECFKCECGGTYHFADTTAMDMAPFDAYFDPTIGKEITSWRQQAAEGKRFRDSDHKHGLSLSQDHPEMLRRWRNIRRHREDYIQEQYKKDGITYKPGSKVKMDDQRGELRPIAGSERQRTYFC